MEIPFREVWSCDFEFYDDPGGLPVVVCMVALELRSRREVRLTGDELRRLAAAPFAVGPDALFVAYYASAELGCFLSLGWPLPINVLDLFCEHREATNGLNLPAGDGLLGASALRGLATISSTEKESSRTVILQKRDSMTAAEIAAAVHYCGTDVAETEALLLAMAKQIDWPHGLWRGRYMTAAARMENCGVPIDRELYQQLSVHWSEIKAGLVKAVDTGYGIFEGTAFKEARFAAFLARNRIPWPRLASGRLALDKDTFKEQARARPTLEPLRQLRITLGMMRLTDLAVGPDDRNRCILSAFRTITGRNAPKSSKFVFNAANWLRGLIRPPEGYGLAYLDWKAQEFAIAAALSGDARMLEDYSTGDPHIAFARTARLVPADATGKTHPIIRERCKSTNLGVLYGMKARGLAARLGLPLMDAEELLRMHRGSYRQFWPWSEAMVHTALLRKEIHTAFGWRMKVTQATKPRTLANWPMQSHGSDMMRGAAIAATESGITVAAPVHDAFLIVAPLDRLEDDIQAMQEIMEQAGRCVTGGLTVRVDVDTVRFPERYRVKDPAMWGTAMDLLARCKGASHL